MYKHLKSKYGFTFGEVMVALVIIAVLIGLIYPFFKMAREKGLQEECASNLRQIATGLYLYAEDHGDAFPVNSKTLGSWGNQLVNGGYLPNDDKIFDCPAHIYNSDGSLARGTVSIPDYWYGNKPNEPDYPLSLSSPEWRMIVMCWDSPHSGGQNILNVAGKVYFEIWSK